MNPFLDVVTDGITDISNEDTNSTGNSTEESESDDIIKEIQIIDETYPNPPNEKSYAFGRSSCKNNAVNVQIK